MDFRRLLQFLTDRNLENLKSVFIAQKIDDGVAGSLSTQQLELLGLVMGNAVAFTREFGSEQSSSASSREVGYSERLNELKSKIKTKHNQCATSVTSDLDRFYNVTVALKTKEEGKFVMKSKRTIVLHVNGECLFQTMLTMARAKFNIRNNTDCYLANSKGQILSKTSKKLIRYVNARKYTKKSPHVYMHYVNTFAHFLWHGELNSIANEVQTDGEQVEQKQSPLQLLQSPLQLLQSPLQLLQVSYFPLSTLHYCVNRIVLFCDGEK